MEFIVKESQHGWTLLAFLKEECKESLSANKVKKAIEAKSCKINGRVEFFSSYQVMKGDRVEFNPIETSKPSKITILFQDDHFAVIDKPPGLVCQNELIVAAIGPIARNWRLVHRLDKDTSGLLLLAKSEKAEEAGKVLFADRGIEKMYLAIVDGRVKDKEGVIDNYLGKKGGYEGQTLYGEVLQKDKGLRAITHFQTLSLGKGASLLLCDIKTGRTHQIRVHFSEKGHPLLGDHQYGRKFSCPFEPSRHLLHAWKLVFTHPFTKKKIELKAQVPLDFQKAIEELFSASLKLE